MTNFSDISAFQRREEPPRDEDPGLAYMLKLDEAVRRRETARKALEDLSEDQGNILRFFLGVKSSTLHFS